MPKLKVHSLHEFDGKIDGLKLNLSDNIQLTVGEKPPSDTEILIAGLPEESHIKACKKLKVLIIPWSGLPRATREIMLKYPQIKVYNIHYNAVSTAEMAVALMMTAVKKIIPIDKKLRMQDWGPRYANIQISSLDNKTAVILGFGAIGQMIAKMCSGLGMKIIGVNRKSKPSDTNLNFQIYPVAKLNDLLPQANVFFISVPLTDETKEMIGKKELALLPDNACIINISRGRVIGEQDLYSELSKGRICAGLDVWYNYPESEESRGLTPPSGYPFKELENVVMTPHLAGHTDESESMRITHLAELLNRISHNELLKDPINISRGY